MFAWPRRVPVPSDSLTRASMPAKAGDAAEVPPIPVKVLFEVSAPSTSWQSV